MAKGKKDAKKHYPLSGSIGGRKNAMFVYGCMGEYGTGIRAGRERKNIKITRSTKILKEAKKDVMVMHCCRRTVEKKFF